MGSDSNDLGINLVSPKVKDFWGSMPPDPPTTTKQGRTSGSFSFKDPHRWCTKSWIRPSFLCVYTCVGVWCKLHLYIYSWCRLQTAKKLRETTLGLLPSQVSPVKPSAQSHPQTPAVLVTVPPFKQVWLAHALTAKRMEGSKVKGELTEQI